MALQVRTRSTRSIGLLAAVSMLGVVVFGALAVRQRDGLAGVLAALCLVAVVRLVRVARRLRTHGSATITAPPDRSHAGPAHAGAAVPAFVTAARQVRGPRFRTGHVVIAADTAVFVADTAWRHLAIELLLALFTTRVRLTEVELAADEGPALAAELAELVRLNGGVILDASWTRRGLTFAHPPSSQLVILEDRPPAEALARWTVRPGPSVVERAQRRRRVIVVGSALAAALLVAGGLAWRFTGLADLMVAAAWFAGMVLIVVVAVAVMSTRVSP